MESADARLRLRSVARLARVLAEPRPLLDLLELAGREIRFALGAASVSLGRLERERGHVRILVNVGQLASWEEPRPSDEVYSVVELPMNIVLVDEVRSYTVSIDDPLADDAAKQLLRSLGMGSAVAAPILLDGVVWGELWAARGPYDLRFEDTDREVAEALAAVLAAGIGQSERIQHAERLSLTDSLTGLANRRAIDRALESALDAHGVDGRPVSVVMGDVNGLKATNDQDGHEAGDALIKTCARAVSTALHVAPGGLAGRIGGDEFCVVLDGYGVEDAEAVATETLRLLAMGPSPRALALGVASTQSAPRDDAESVTPRRLMRWADEAQYAAKRQNLAVPVVAGRDVPLAEPVERRARRRDPGTGVQRGGDRASAALERGLEAIVRVAEGPPLDRVVAAMDAAGDAFAASGWVVAALEADPTSRQHAVLRTLAFSAARDGLLVDARIRVSEADAAWIGSASATGLLVGDGDGGRDAGAGLVSARGCRTVAAAATGAWWVELLADGAVQLDGAPAVLRSLVCVAVAG